MSFLMESELYSAPEAVKACYDRNYDIVLKLKDEVKKRQINNIVTVARGTSRNASTCFKVFTEVLAGIPVSQADFSTYNIYNAKINMDKSLVVAVSQSGGSPDTLNVVKSAKESGALTVAVTNNLNSPLANVAHFVIFTDVGEERAVAATKTFIGQLTALLMISGALANKNIDFENIVKILCNLKPQLKNISLLSKEIAKFDKLIILSRGVTESISREAGLKLTETTYKMTFTGSANEFHHGPKALISKGTPVILLAPSGVFTNYYIDFVKDIKDKGAYVISLSDITEVNKLSNISFTMPSVDFCSASIVYAFAIQALALYTAEALGLNPDAPRSLNKITITE